MVLSKVPRLSNVHSLKDSLLHRPRNLLPALRQVTPVSNHDPQAKGLLKARELLPARAPLSEVKGVRLKLRGSSLSPSSRNPPQEALVRNLQRANPSSKGLPSPLGSCHREDHSSRGLLISKVAPEHPQPSNPDPLLQEDDPRCSKSLSPRKNPARTTRLWAVLRS